MNHFFTIWTKPEQTLRHMIDEKSIGYGILVVILGSLGSSVFAFADNGLMADFSLPVILIASFALVVLLGIPIYFFNAAVYFWLGKMLGGQARYKEVCLATASGALPMLGVIPVSVLALILYGKSLYAEILEPFAITNMSMGFYFLHMIVTLGLSIYSVVILSKGLGYAHKFSALRGFGTVMIYTAIVFVVVILLIFLSLIVGVYLFS